ncbi:MAG: GNAT family N-acetyltransferase [Bdellovibrionales bacterium]|nr:GNAT family N-acetyltransferase [Bdellovibrionales bacterium]
MQLPQTIAGKRISLVQMPLDFIQKTVAGEKPTTNLFITHPDWYKETELADMRLHQMQRDPSVASWLLRAIVDTKSQQMIGHFNCHDKVGSDFLQKYWGNAVEFGYTIYKPYRRNGFATETVLTMMDFLKNNTLASAIILAAAVDNHASLAMIRQLGFTEIDTVDEDDVSEIVFIKKFSDS